jgi:lysophospholipase L1-like esterase
VTTGDSPAPFVRGCAWPGNDDVAYPRADPADLDRLPGDTVASARLPVGVRLEFVGDAAAIDLDYVTRTDDLGYRGSGAGTAFALVVGGEIVAEASAVLGSGTVRFDLDAVAARGSELRRLVYLPEGMQPVVTAVRALGGAIDPAPPQPRWLAYGDSIVEGWIATGPVRAWPAIAGREFGLDVVNLGYAGAARGEIVSAEQIARLDAAVISVSHGTNCWSRIPFSAEMFRAQTRAFLSVLREGHPATPIVVTSPVIRPDAEAVPNRLGATLDDLRVVMEDVARERIAGGDDALTLVEGRGRLLPRDLPDGIHPGDDGHAALAAAFGGAVHDAMRVRT